MNKIVEVDGEVYAILVSADSVKDGTEWFGNQSESLQASRMKYPSGKSFRVHRHILNPRVIKRTQEAFIVISGKIAVDIYANPKPKHDWKPELIGTLEASSGEAVFVYRGGHGIMVIEDFMGYEIKAGAFSFISEDKEFHND